MKLKYNPIRIKIGKQSIRLRVKMKDREREAFTHTDREKLKKKKKLDKNCPLHSIPDGVGSKRYACVC